MKTSLFLTTLLAAAAAFAGTSARAQFNFVPNDIVIYRVGDGTAALSNAGTTVFLDQYTPAGVAAGSYNLTTAGGIPLVASGSATSEGLLNLSADGRSLLATGYDQAPGTAGVAATTSAAVPRIVNVVGPTGAVTQTTVNGFSGNNIRSAITADNATLYLSGGTTGILSVAAGTGTGTTGAAPATVSSTLTTNRGLVVSGGQLYFSTGSGTTRINSLGSAASPNAAAVPVGITTGGTSPYQFVLSTLTVGGTGADTIYVADSAAGIEKYTLTGGSFTLTSTVTLANVTGLIGLTVGTTETLFATTPTGLYSLVDATGVGGAIVTTPTLLATAGTNTAFRGLAFAPAAVPEPSVTALLLPAVGFAGWLSLRRRSRRSAA